MQDQPTTFLPASAVRVRYGGISDVTLWRWVRSHGFPAPIKPNGRHRLWKLSELEAYEASRAEAATQAA